MASDPSKYDRRESDQVSSMINGRISELSQQLKDHITDCSAQSRRLFWAVVSVLGWLVANGIVLPFFQKLGN